MSFFNNLFCEKFLLAKLLILLVLNILLRILKLKLVRFSAVILSLRKFLDIENILVANSFIILVNLEMKLFSQIIQIGI